MASPSSYHDQGRLQSLQPALIFRSRVLSAIRKWFEAAGFTEVDTPVRIPVPALELHIDAEPSGAGFLRTSPELHMKRLLAAGYDTLFQIGPCFRKGEWGRLHHPEYTMLEWYRANADYLDILHDTESLLTQVSRSVCPGRLPAPPWPRFTVEELYIKHAGWNPVTAYDAERFEHDLVAMIEPALPRDTPAFVMDYPAAAAALSRRKPGHESVAERFELYINGVEITNAFSELTDPAEQRRRFEQCAKDRAAMGAPAYPLDEAFLAALELGMPPAGGIAMGIDRLVMVLLGATSLDEVIAFRENVRG
ncbi:MAG: EF-P lysine aminoacylase EpmA [bacterium]